MEVLSAAAILIVALVGISMAATSGLKKSRTPGIVEQCTLLAAERLNYFRTQPDPYRAVGGTHYVFRAQDPADFNLDPAFNNNYNRNPTLFVREYLYDTTEGVMKTAAGVDAGRDNQRLATLQGNGTETLNGQTYGRNQVPPSFIGVGGLTLMRVCPNDGSAGAMGPPAPAVPDPSYRGMAAPRANPNLPPGVNGALPPEIKFVREVWVQTNHPSFTAAGPAAPAAANPPASARNLPPYTVAVTVRVFARDPQTLKYNPTTNPATAVRNADFSGPGYDRSKPLASLTGYFSLKRILN